MKTAKKLFAAVLAFAFWVSIIPAAFAAQESENYNTTEMTSSVISGEGYLSIIDALNSIIPFKNELGLENVDFSKLEVGKQINLYEYKDDEFVSLDFSLYPLFQHKTLVALAVLSSDGTSNIDTQFALKLAEYVTQGDEIAILYDTASCYLYNNRELILLTDNSHPISERGILPIIIDETKSSQISCTTYGNDTLSLEIDENSTSNHSPSTYYECTGVKFVTQNPPSHICWAASVACISNYLYGTKYTAREVAMTQFQSDDYDYPADALPVLHDFNINYHYQAFTDAWVHINIIDGYPPCAYFKVTGGGNHIVVVFGVDLDYIWIMDPEFGPVKVWLSSNGKYEYDSPFSGTHLTSSFMYAYE